MILCNKLLLDRATSQLASWLALFTNHKIGSARARSKRRAELLRARASSLSSSFFCSPNSNTPTAILSYQIVMQGFFTANTKYVRLTLAKNVLEHHHNWIGQMIFVQAKLIMFHVLTAHENTKLCQTSLHIRMDADFYYLQQRTLNFDTSCWLLVHVSKNSTCVG